MKVVVERSLDGVDPAAWQRLAAGNVYAQAGWLRAVEHGVDGGAAARYILLYRGGELRAAAIAYCLERARGPSRFDELMYGRFAGHAAALHLPPTRTLFAGPLIGHDSYLLAPFDETGDALLDELLRALVDLAERERAVLCVPRLPAAATAATAALRRTSLLEFPWWPTTVLELPFASLDDYVASLSNHGRSAATKARREIAAPAKHGVELTSGFDTADAGALCSLLAGHDQRLGGTDSRIRPELFAAVAGRRDNGVITTVARHDGRIVGFALLLVAPPNAAGPVIAVADEPVNRRAFTYFNLAFYEPIRLAIARGVTSLELGGGMLGMKQRRGFATHPVNLFVRPGGALARTGWLALRALHRRRMTGA